uniref:hypothetical protein n=1 Tax=Flavobacterium sp. TaxID=239 RepID=UPI00404A8D71
MKLKIILLALITCLAVKSYSQANYFVTEVMVYGPDERNYEMYISSITKCDIKEKEMNYMDKKKYITNAFVDLLKEKYNVTSDLTLSGDQLNNKPYPIGTNFSCQFFATYEEAEKFRNKEIQLRTSGSIRQKVKEIPFEYNCINQ